MIRALIAVGVTIAAFVLGTIGFIYTGFYNVGADTPPSSAKEWFLETTMERSVAMRAGNVEVPDLDGEERKIRGAGYYDMMCRGCHGAPGIERADMATMTQPPAPKLADAAGEWSEAEMFWITKHGIQMTGMPAFGLKHPDEELWDMVALMRSFDDMTPEEYQKLVDRASVEHDHSK